MDRALFEAFAVVWERLKGDQDELRARLARRRGAEMGRPPRAWCLAVRASDRRVEPYRTAIVKYYRDGEVEREEVTLDAEVLGRVCAPVEIAEGGETLAAVAKKLGVHPESLAHARRAGAFTERRVPRFRGTVPVLYREGLMDPSAPVGRPPDRMWGWAWRSAAARLPKDFEQVVERRPDYRVLRGRRVARGWRWICPGCKARVRVIFLPVRPINLAEYFGVKPEVDAELDAVADSPRVFGCARCHRVRYFSRVDRCGWNSLIAHAAGGLLYGHEVRRPEYWRSTRRRAYRRSAKRAPSKRRAEVLGMLREGLKVKEIAAGLGIAVNTVVGHMKVIYREMGMHSRGELSALGGGGIGGSEEVCLT